MNRAGMYAAVGSYMVRVYRLHDLRFTRYPKIWLTTVLAVAIYANFFTQHFIFDLRWCVALSKSRSRLAAGLAAEACVVVLVDDHFGGHGHLGLPAEVAGRRGSARSVGAVPTRAAPRRASRVANARS